MGWNRLEMAMASVAALLPLLGGAFAGQDPALPPPPADTIKPGDKVRVTQGPAPVKVGKTVVATAREGQEFKVTEVLGDWVGVTIEQGGDKITGWVHRRCLSCAAAPPGEPQAGGAPGLFTWSERIQARHPGTEPLALATSQELSRALADAIVKSYRGKNCAIATCPVDTYGYITKSAYATGDLPEELLLSKPGGPCCSVWSSLEWVVVVVGAGKAQCEIDKKHAGAIVLLLDRLEFADRHLVPGDLLFFDGRVWTSVTKAEAAKRLLGLIAAWRQGEFHATVWYSCPLLVDESATLSPVLRAEFEKWTKVNPPGRAQMRALAAMGDARALPLLRSVYDKVRPEDKNVMDLAIRLLETRWAKEDRP